jgi:asparagine synthetase B (glutamine-hydrolysing)
MIQFDVPSVSNFVWCGGERCEEPASLDPKGPDLHDLQGQFALHFTSDEREHFLFRDPLGVNKLFFGLSGERFDVSSFFFDLRQRGYPAEDIWSVPSGHRIAIHLDQRSYRLEKLDSSDAAKGMVARPPGMAEPELTDVIRETLGLWFRRLKAVVNDRPLYVTMSGGLDSTVISVLAREILGPFTGLSFGLADDPTASSDGDLDFARRLAEHLGVKLLEITPSRNELLELLDPVLVYGQDFRDFNVHCGLVNAAIGRALQVLRRDQSADPRPLLLSGDTMNELVADYTPVTYREQTFYDLPRLPPGTLRRFLVAGLDSGDREVGIFSHFGLDVIQPYALCKNAYLQIPEADLASPDIKQNLVRKVMGTRVPDFIYERPKVRAQVGSSKEVGGTLATMIDAGLDQTAVSERFCQLIGLSRDQLRRWIRGGFYRFTDQFPS